MTATIRTMILLAAMLACNLIQPWSHAMAQAQYADDTKLPEGARGELIAGLIAAINANDEESFKAFMDSHFDPGFRDQVPMEVHRDFARQTYETSHGYQFHSIRTYPDRTDATRIVVIVRNQLIESWEAIVISVTETDPPLISGLGVQAARPPLDFVEEVRTIAPEALQGELDKLLDRLAKADAFSGSVLIARDGAVLASGARGLASKAWEAPNRFDTKFNLGSMNKMFTAVALAQLAEAGKLSLDDPASKFLDETWLRGPNSEKITIAHLLSHRSGLGSYFNDVYENISRMKLVELDDYLPLFADDVPQFEPGSRFEYSNTGYILAGKIIEIVSGENYFDYIRAHIYEPAGMADTDCFNLSEDIPNLATGYIEHPREGRWTNNTFFHVMRGGPAGGGYSTAPDLLRFAQALGSGKLVSKESLAKLTSPAGQDYYGLGFMLENGPLGPGFGHNGGFPGLNSVMLHFPGSGFTIVAMSNYSAGAQVITGPLERLAAGLESAGK